ncbi:MAG: nucleotide sugar dehydrogenase, partial [Rhodospirillales bacterium]|nr:nucleotide sugar dehydrogenase [Rhodospirillales bacterium]
YVARIPLSREHPHLAGRTSVAWDEIFAGGYDAALICTDHDEVDYTALVEALPLVVDTRNATRGLHGVRDNIVMA